MMANGPVMNCCQVNGMPQTLEENNNTLKPIYSTKSSEYGGGRQIRKVSDSEYYREVSMGKAPDTFPCGHVLCHKCIRKSMTPTTNGKLECPICGKEAARMFTADPGDSIGFNMSDVDNITLLSNFDDIVKKFDGLKYSIRRLRCESVQSRSLAMTFTNCGCHMCDESHGTLQVLQEFNQLRVSHIRPRLPPYYFYRLCHGEVVTSFYSLVNSCCICVPCTYKELRESKHFPNLKSLSDDEAVNNPKSILTEVGKIIAKNTAPLESLHGKNVIEIDHMIKLQERADDFKFEDATVKIKKMVNEQEQQLIKHASYVVQDKGGVIHMKSKNSIEQNTNETVV
ncbi:uncharacterized protein LOC123551048 [Mercenaria mercenaria]|uniref:uncharacterized protein LOC123551048 n=1 Tax=Mercenaria mercenaria TaxID=6596 RepID=UPI00234F70C8|nr:uncharacterized protein LOC123551048 [Mercenaria mercenaria]XP_045195621.2 uncharacterized protein LOC123551048 [Mercenaria mercenaria]XP_045195622.2 uncharacterized protein LOC123551048 [Mercenaria mercenaria]XP_045195623.2 uncharacterized protein LOC123551048 [Mercenaria mercenaria]XP_045195625.2 uncharacterized protein LOC123551048 [Mercenaria mercenaria]XP_053396497.1 uncharacterized protein LOC123551048 [Mercenaria mercenaria]